MDSLKKNNLDQAIDILSEVPEFLQKDRYNYIILNSLKKYLYVFKEKKIINSKENFGNFTLINETFQRCYLGDQKTDSFFYNLTNNSQDDYSRYIYFYLIKNLGLSSS